MEKKQILIQGKVLSYYQSWNIGKIWVLVFLHGWMQDGTSFRDIFTHLEGKNIPYISFDLPGFGSSALLHDNMTIEEYGEGVIECIEKLWLTKPVLVWHSFWGRISIYLWSFYTNISGIVLIWAAWIATQMNPIKLAIVKTWKLIFSVPGLSKLKNKVKSAAWSSDYASSGKMEKIFRNTISNDLRKYMKHISLPTLMIWWNDDDQVPISEAKLMHENIQGSNLHILEWSHFVHQEKAKEITTMILDFIKK